jgi:hypothetical protein
VTPDEPGIGQPIHQFDSTVVLDLQPLGDFGHSRTSSRRQSFQSQHELVLSRLQPGPSRVLLAEVQETANLVSQFRKRLIIH